MIKRHKSRKMNALKRELVMWTQLELDFLVNTSNLVMLSDLICSICACATGGVSAWGVRREFLGETCLDAPESIATGAVLAHKYGFTSSNLRD